MTIKKLLFLFSLLSAILLTSCKSDEVEVPSSSPYLISYTKALTISTEKAETLFGFLASSFIAADDIVDNINYNVDLYTVVYRTQYKGMPIVASGVVCIPDTNLSFPVLSFQNGTNLEHSKAPSLDLQDDLSLFRFIEAFSSTGFILTISDYVGFGVSSDFLHPYHHKKSNDRLIVDLIKAAEELAAQEDVKAEVEKDLYLLGYSQGGWSTLSVLKDIETTNVLNDYNVKAVSSGAGSYKLVDVAAYTLAQQTHPNPFYFAFIIYSQIHNGFLDANLSDIFQEPYASNIPSLYNGLYTSEEVNDMLTDTIADLFNTSFINDYDNILYKNVREMLEKNSVTAWNVQTNLRIYHSIDDNSVPILSTYNMISDFESIMGTNIPNIEMIEFNGLDHNDVIVPWGVESMKWFLNIN